jgi:hypothetical protein
LSKRSSLRPPRTLHGGSGDFQGSRHAESASPLAVRAASPEFAALRVIGTQDLTASR